MRMSASVIAAEGAANTARVPTRTSRRVEAIVPAAAENTIQSAGSPFKPTALAPEAAAA